MMMRELGVHANRIKYGIVLWYVIVVTCVFDAASCSLRLNGTMNQWSEAQLLRALNNSFQKVVVPYFDQTHQRLDGLNDRLDARNTEFCNALDEVAAKITAHHDMIGANLDALGDGIDADLDALGTSIGAGIGAIRDRIRADISALDEVDTIDS